MAKLSIKNALSKADRFLKTGRELEARAIYQTVMHADPSNKKAARGLKLAARSFPRTEVADPPGPMLDEVLRLLNAGEFKQAAVRAKNSLKKFPNSPNLWNLRALACNGMHRFEEAVAACEMVASLSPSSHQAYLNLGNALRQVERYDAATAALEKALELKPDYPFAYNSLGNVQSSQSMSEKAIESFSKAIAMDPKYAEAHYNLGSEQLSIDLLDDALKSFRATVNLNPDYGKVYRGMASITKLKLDDPVVEKMRSLDEKLGAAGETDHRSYVCFALAKVYRDNRDYEQSFKFLKEGNALLAKHLRYDASRDSAQFKKIKSAAPKIAKSSFDASEDPRSVTPIFILGMPRSGTTLTEQILACHTDVTAAGELGYVNEFGGGLVLGDRIPSQKNLMQFRKRYFLAIEKLAAGKKFVTDKMPHNFRSVGLIRKAIPEAVIINLKRDPAAVCWSNYWQFFPRVALGYSTGIDTCVAYFEMYQDLMQYWQKNLPGQINVLDYESLVEFQEEETRALLETCGLPWQEDCLSPHKKKRDVKTASKYQVTEPVYTGSSAAWKAYDSYLDGAFDALVAQSAQVGS